MFDGVLNGGYCTPTSPVIRIGSSFADTIPISYGDNMFSIVFSIYSYSIQNSVKHGLLACNTGTFVFRIHTNNFIQLSGDISAGYPPLGQAGLQSHPIGSYQTLAPYLNNTSISSLLISNVNSIPQMNIPVQNLPILQQSNLAKPQIQPLVPGASGADKARSSLLESFRSNQVRFHNHGVWTFVSSS